MTRQPHARRVYLPPDEPLWLALLELAGVALFALAIVLVWAGLG